jgi:iron complex outermembrane recepter protein
MRFVRLLAAASCLSLVVVSAAQADDQQQVDQILTMSLSELSTVKVTSVSKTAENANQAAAAVFVITQEDIKRSGATSIPEALRMAPGLDVAQAGGHDWAVSSRGFNGQFANKLLVLIDGRTVYNPMFSGTYWQVQDVMLEDIDRIEIIRGPGAAQWGANAVNGVINIITKNAKDTQGGLASASAGNMIKTDDSVRYGVKTGEDSYARVYAKYNDDAPEFNVGAGRSDDAWQKRQAGFRSDSKIDDQDSLTLQGDAYNSHESELFNFPSLSSMTGLAVTLGDIEASGGNVLARWTRTISPQSSTSTQLYLDNTQYANGYTHYNTTTADFDFQHTWTGWDRNEMVWGTGYRLIEDHEGVTPLFNLAPLERDDSVLSAFLQDKYTLHPDDLFLTLGSKFEHNPYTGFEVQPSARLSYLLSDTQMTWGSVSRAVHPANRFTDDADPLLLGVAPPGVFHAGVPALVGAVGNQGLDSEDLIAYELGYRLQPTRTVSLDAATFYNDYRNLFAGTYGQGYLAGGGSYWFQPIYAANQNTAHSEGFELSAKVDATKNWQLAASYTYLDLIFAQRTDPAFVFTNNPKNQFNVRSTYLFPYDIEMTNSLYYVDGLTQTDIPGYYRFDTKLSKEIMTGVEVSLVGQNLLTAYHREFSPFLYESPVEVGRSVYGNLTWKF